MRVIRSVLYPAVACVLSFSTHAFAQTTDSLVAATVNDEQTTRGRTVFTKVCVECHTPSDITGADFKLKWHTRPVFDLFEVIRTTMPDNAPGTLTRDEYIDVTTYILKLNGAPAGGMPVLGTDTTGMRKLRMEITVPPPVIDTIKPKTDTTLAAQTARLFSRTRRTH